ncbi:MAG: PaaI family thioesterase [Myxococcales bacterium]|nr:PaaI family thioesterase [Myxococcales bacterium]
MPKMTIAEIEALMDQGFPDWRSFSRITDLGERTLTLMMPFRKELLRAGGTISGPAMMALADTAAYFLTLAQAGPVASAATANLDIHFLARPDPVDVVATATMLRLGRRLSVSAVDLHAGADLVAHATITYALPPASRAAHP